jgi:Predicted membrane protein (DUF2339)
MAQLFTVFYVIFALATPVLVVYALVKHWQLKAKFQHLSEELQTKLAASERQVARLTSRVHALETAATPKKVVEVGEPETVRKVEPAIKAVEPESKIAPPIAMVAVPPPPAAPPRPPIPTPVIPTVPVRTEQTEKPAAPIEPSDVHKVPVVDHPATRPPVPAPPWRTVPQGKKPISPAAVPPPPTPPSAVEHPAMAARIATPPPKEAFRYAAPKPTMQERIRKVSAIEESLGTNWLLKVGIIMMVLGIASFGIYEFTKMGAAGKVVLLYVLSLSLILGGIFFEKRENYRLLGRTFVGGGWALLFFTTYAIYHVVAMHVMDSLTLDCILMLAVAVAMGAHTLRYRSQFVTGLAFLLGYTTVALSHDTVYSLSAGVILAIGLVLIVLKMSWFELEVFGILSSYLNHLYWLYRILGPAGAQGRDFPEYHASLAMLLFYWVIFRISYVARDVKTVFEEHVSTAAAVLNALLLLGAMKFQSVQPQLAYLALLAIGLLEFSFGQLPRTRRRREAFILLSVMGAALMLAAAPFHYSGNNVAILWLLGAEIFLFAGVIVKEVVFRRIGLFTGLLVGIHLAMVDAGPILLKENFGKVVLLPAGILFALTAVVFYGNLVGIGKRWKEMFSATLDSALLDALSYIAAASSMLAVWALTNKDWTAAALAGVMIALAMLTKRFPSSHLQIQYSAVGLLTFFRMTSVNMHFGAGQDAHIPARLFTLPIIGAAFYLTAKLAPLRDDSEQRVIQGAFAAFGTAVMAMLIWCEVPELWMPVAYVVFAVALSELARALRYPLLAWHGHVIGMFALFTAVMADTVGAHQWHSMPVHGFSALAVVAGYYWIAARPGYTGSRAQSGETVPRQEEKHFALARAIYTWAAAGLMCWAMWELVHAPWIAVAWIALAVSLALAARWLKYTQLAWQGNLVAIFAMLRTLSFNYELEEKIWWEISLRVVTVSLVATGLYFISRKGAPESQTKRLLAFVHSFAGTGLLALLAWYEAPNGWLAPLWAGFALVLALIDHRFELEELGWQVHILSLLALGRGFAFNLHSGETWHGWSVRLLSLSFVAVFFYVLSRVVRIPEEWPERDVRHGYSWAASSVVGFVLWYELVPLNIAIGWAVFGLVLFEYGKLRDIRQFRYQSYVALFASFVRIFFGNLGAGEPGHFWNSRTYSILPLVAIYFFIYAQLSGEDAGGAQEKDSVRGFKVGDVLATLGTATIVALFYFQFPIEWVATSWAAVVLVLFALVYSLNRTIFLYQGMAATLLVLQRGMTHNLFGAGYFSGGDWKGRFFVLGSAIALLLATLLFAFPLRSRIKGSRILAKLPNYLAWPVSRPEQLQFFVPVILLTCMLALKMRAGMVTVSWGVEGVLIFLLALALGERSFRLTGLGILLLCVGKVMVLDIWRLQRRDQYITLIIVGASLVVVSYLFTRYRETIRQLL